MINKITPVNGEYEVEVKPYSIVTISTLDKESEVEGFEYESEPKEVLKNPQSTLDKVAAAKTSLEAAVEGLAIINE